MNRPSVLQAIWPDDMDEIRTVRNAVFVVEQAVDPALEWDGLDSCCEHILVRGERGQPIATGRLQPDGKIGRMAVLPRYRRQGIGASVLNKLLLVAGNKGMTDVYLHAQVHAMNFYLHQGFQAEGEIYREAGIPHQTMRFSINSGLKKDS